MRYLDLTDPSDLDGLNAQQWQVEAIKLNPEYCSWGNYEDYMMHNGGGWSAPLEINSWDEFASTFNLDELNELVNFYFELRRESENCQVCEQTGYNSSTLALSKTWSAWQNQLADVEVEAMMMSGRMPTTLTNQIRYDFEESSQTWFGRRTGPGQSRQICDRPKMPLADDVNDYYRSDPFSMDSVVAYVCIQARAKALGVDGVCDNCQGEGFVYTTPAASLRLQLWMLHPRKGCSRGVYIKEVLEQDLPQVFAVLRQAAARNTERFAKVIAIEPTQST